MTGQTCSGMKAHFHGGPYSGDSCMMDKPPKFILLPAPFKGESLQWVLTGLAADDSVVAWKHVYELQRVDKDGARYEYADCVEV